MLSINAQKRKSIRKKMDANMVMNAKIKNFYGVWRETRERIYDTNVPTPIIPYLVRCGDIAAVRKPNVSKNS